MTAREPGTQVVALPQVVVSSGPSSTQDPKQKKCKTSAVPSAKAWTSLRFRPLSRAQETSVPMSIQTPDQNQLRLPSDLANKIRESASNETPRTIKYQALEALVAPGRPLPPNCTKRLSPLPPKKTTTRHSRLPNFSKAA